MTVPAALEAAETIGGSAETRMATRAARTPRTASRPPAPGPARAPKPATPAKRAIGAGKTPGGFSLPGGQGAHRLLVAEFALCVVLVGMTPVVMRKPDDQGRLYVPNDIVRVSAVSLIFFTLALLSNTRGGSRFASAFGALITLGVLYNTAGTITALGSIFHTSAKTGTVQTADAGSASVAKPTFTPVDLGANPLAQAAGGASGAQGPQPTSGVVTPQASAV
jgi:hypothetical protein